jgi:hypothetical protein
MYELTCPMYLGQVFFMARNVCMKYENKLCKVLGVFHRNWVACLALAVMIAVWSCTETGGAVEPNAEEQNTEEQNTEENSLLDELPNPNPNNADTGKEIVDTPSVMPEPTPDTPDYPAKPFSLQVASEADVDDQYELVVQLSREAYIEKLKLVLLKDGQIEQGLYYTFCGYSNPCELQIGVLISGYSDFIDGLCNADYTLIVDLWDTNGNQYSQAQDFTVTDLGECNAQPVSSSYYTSSSALTDDVYLTAKTKVLPVGAQDSPYRMAVDLDAWQVYSSSERVAHYGQLDLGYGVISSGPILFTPFYGEGVFGTWCENNNVDRCNEVEIFETDLDANSFAEVDKLSELFAVIMETGEAAQSVSVKPGMVVVVLTEEFDVETGAGIFLVLVDTQSSTGPDGYITIKGITV